MKKYKLRWYLFFSLIEKIKIFNFLYLTKSNILISINIIKVNFNLTILVDIEILLLVK